MFENDSSADLDDTEILEKFSNLLNKYQNQLESGTNSMQNENPESNQSSGDRPKLDTSNIPILSEMVVLHQSVMQLQTKRNSPIRYVLDVALKDVGIEMNNLERSALADALETRLAEPKNPNHS
ncbi:hypothetical protein W03_18390 [Nitrosomonas sp. PY1]|uniref:hypothetical protein n=1 Tax=Nitrosomonas sp. PY1 TaxID=1803906 RepID=UPI001FC8D904|nr:hypothetical protein [Nitrosomonas sp. PY1]GKS69835.1 hypothetical protein W03_18390 [Nitrosomonas sp. PY1]